MKYHNLILRVWMRKIFTVLIIIRSFFHLSCTSLPTGELESLKPALKRAGFHHHPSSWGCEPEIWLQSAHRHNSKRNDRKIGRFFCSSLRSKTHCHTTKTDPAVIQNTTEGKDPTHKIQSPPWSQTFLHINQKHCFTKHEIHVLIRTAPDWTWSISTFQSSTAS